MRVLMLAWEYPPHVVGGLGSHVMHLAPALARAGIEVHVLTPALRGGNGQEIKQDGLHVHRIEVHHLDQSDFVWFTQQVNGMLERAAHVLYEQVNGFDLIHTHDWLGAAAGIALKHYWRLPLVATVHATERGRGQGHLWTRQAEQINHTEWELTYEAWRVIVCSHFMADQLQHYFLTPSDKLDVVPNGVVIRPCPFASAAARLAFRRQFVADDEQLVYNVGRVVFEKGVHVLLEAWPKVQELVPNARLLIAGTGGHLDRLKARAWELRLGDSVLFTGFIPDDQRDKLYHVADAAVFPSLYEPFGIVALEAMAARCPVVVSQTGGLLEVVHTHKTGLTVPPNDVDALVWGITHTLQNGPWTNARVENAFNEVQDVFNWDRIAAHTIDVYDRVYAEWQADDWGKDVNR